MKKNNSFKGKLLLPFIGMLVVLVFIIPLLLHVFRTPLSWLFSFANHTEYIAAYIGAIGVAIGSFIAIWGALWVQNTQNEYEKQKTAKSNANILLNAINHALRQLEMEFEIVKNVDNINTGNEIKLSKEFSEHIAGNEFFFCTEWVFYVMQLKDYLSELEIQQINKVSSFLADIRDAIRTNDCEAVHKIYTTRIRFLIDRNDDVFSMSNMCKKVIKCLSQLA